MCCLGFGVVWGLGWFRVFRYLGFRDVTSFGAWIAELDSCGLSSRDVRCTPCCLGFRGLGFRVVSCLRS